MNFHFEQFLGHWYELAHYKSWFQPENSYNIIIEYQVNNGQIVVHNKMNIFIPQRGSVAIRAYGVGSVVGQNRLQILFPEVERQKLSSGLMIPSDHVLGVDFIVRKAWTDAAGKYIFAIATNTDKSMVWVLSRQKQPPSWEVAEIMAWLFTNDFDMAKLKWVVQR